MKAEHKVWSPLWLEYSGLPELLGEKVRGGTGWPVFKKIVELDCEHNSQPETVEIALTDLAWRVGIAAPAIRKAALALRKLKLLACFLPEDDEETALFKVRMPLVTPRSVDEIKAAWPQLFMDPPQRFRYVDEPMESEQSEKEDPILQEIVDLYFNTVGLKMNSFVLDELRLLRAKFSPDLVRRTFRRAQQNEIHSLSWVVRELIRIKKNDEEKDSNSK